MARPSGTTRQGLGLDGLDCSPILAGQPVVGEVKVDAGRLDRAVPGLSLDRFERHPCFAQPGETRVAQLVAGDPLELSSSTGARHDLVEPCRAQRLPSSLSLQHNEDVSVAEVRGRSDSKYAARVLKNRAEIGTMR